MPTRRKVKGITAALVRRIALELPGAEEGSSYGTPAWKVKGKLFARMHQSGESVVVKIDFDERDFAMQANPKAFYITDHYTNTEMMLVRFSAVSEREMRELLETSWRRSAPKRLIAAFDL